MAESLLAEAGGFPLQAAAARVGPIRQGRERFARGVGAGAEVGAEGDRLGRRSIARDGTAHGDEFAAALFIRGHRGGGAGHPVRTGLPLFRGRRVPEEPGPCTRCGRCRISHSGVAIDLRLAPLVHPEHHLGAAVAPGSDGARHVEGDDGLHGVRLVAVDGRAGVGRQRRLPVGVVPAGTGLGCGDVGARGVRGRGGARDGAREDAGRKSGYGERGQGYRGGTAYRHDVIVTRVGCLMCGDPLPADLVLRGTSATG